MCALRGQLICLAQCDPVRASGKNTSKKGWVFLSFYFINAVEDELNEVPASVAGVPHLAGREATPTGGRDLNIKTPFLA